MATSGPRGLLLELFSDKRFGLDVTSSFSVTSLDRRSSGSSRQF